MANPVLCIGELLIDFFCTEVNVNLEQGKTFEKQAGGAPANVCATISKLGGQANFCGKVGDDAFGNFLENSLVNVGVGTNFLVKDPNYTTTLAFVSRQTGGERDFMFHRVADVQLQLDELDGKAILQHTIVHFGSATALLDGPFYSTYLKLFSRFASQDSFLSFDPNYREDLWYGRRDQFVKRCVPFLKAAHFVKVSEEELTILTGHTTLEQGTQALHKLGVNWLVVTCGAAGTYASNGQNLVNIPSVEVNSIDSTGAGDAFVGAMLYQFSQQQNPLSYSTEQLHDMIAFANRVGAKVCEKIGAITALPTLEDMLR
jgi:fructokinase